MKILAMILGAVVAWSPVLAAGTATGLEGEYVDTGTSGATLSVTGDRWLIKFGGMDFDNTYTAKKTGDNAYEVTITPLDKKLKRYVSVARKRATYFSS